MRPGSTNEHKTRTAMRYRNSCAPALSGLEPIKRPGKCLIRLGASARKHLLIKYTLVSTNSRSARSCKYSIIKRITHSSCLKEISVNLSITKTGNFYG